MIAHHKLDPGQSAEVKSFDVAEWFYLRQPGRYVLRWQREEPAPAPFEFEVTADPVLAAADGDPVGRLLPLLKESWSLTGPPVQATPLNPGGNRAPTTGRVFLLTSGSTKSKDGSQVWLWLTNEAAADQAPADAEKAGTTQHRPKQLAQSARSSRSVTSGRRDARW